MAPARTPFDQLPAPQQASILCGEAAFRRFVASRLAIYEAGAAVSETAAAEYLRRQCRFRSRSVLATDDIARSRFEALRTEYDAWRGRIPVPRD